MLKRASNQCLTDQFPTHPNREFLGALQGIKSGDRGNFRSDQGIPLSSTILAFAPADKSDRPDRSRTLPRGRIGTPPGARSRRSRSRARGRCPAQATLSLSDNRAITELTVVGGPRVRILLPPAGSPLRTRDEAALGSRPVRHLPPRGRLSPNVAGPMPAAKGRPVILGIARRQCRLAQPRK